MPQITAHSGGGCGIRTREGVNPTRFPTLGPVVLSRPRRSGVSAYELLATLDGRRRTVANETGTETGDRLLIRQAWYAVQHVFVPRTSAPACARWCVAVGR